MPVYAEAHGRLEHPLRGTSRLARATKEASPKGSRSSRRRSRVMPRRLVGICTMAAAVVLLMTNVAAAHVTVQPGSLPKGAATYSSASRHRTRAPPARQSSGSKSIFRPTTRFSVFRRSHKRDGTSRSRRRHCRSRSRLTTVKSQRGLSGGVDDNRIRNRPGPVRTVHAPRRDPAQQHEFLDLQGHPDLQRRHRRPVDRTDRQGHSRSRESDTPLKLTNQARAETRARGPNRASGQVPNGC